MEKVHQSCKICYRYLPGHSTMQSKHMLGAYLSNNQRRVNSLGPYPIVSVPREDYKRLGDDPGMFPDVPT